MSTYKGNKGKAFEIFGAGVQPATSVAIDVEGHNQKKSKTAPGMMVDMMMKTDVTMIENSALKAEIEEIKLKVAELDGVVAEFDGVSITRKIDPKLIKRSPWANRDESGLTDENGHFKSLKDEIKHAGGNVQPIKVRSILGTDPQEYEIVFGHRRHRACLDLGIDVLATIEHLDDKALFIEMDRENRLRADLSPYEQGLMYKRALDEEMFASQIAMASDLGVEQGTVSKAITLANLPKQILNAFESHLDIQFRWASALNKILKSDRDVAYARADEIVAKRADGTIISSQDAFNSLINKEEKAVAIKPKLVNVGNRVLSISQRNNKVSFELDVLSKDKLNKIEVFIAKLMEE